jgi:mannose-6-phosphate isomerase-like protein (cupin superfamily)
MNHFVNQQTRRPVVRAMHQQRRFEIFGKEAATPIIDSEEVDCGYAIWLHEADPGVSPPRHIHHREDEIFHILAGRLLLWCDGKTYEAGEGDTVCLPKGVPHTWLVTSAVPAKLLATVVPGGLMSFFNQMARLGVGHDALAESTRLMEEFGLEVVGPPLEGVPDPSAGSASERVHSAMADRMCR